MGWCWGLLMDFISLSLDLEEWFDMTKALCLKVFYLKKEKESNEGIK